MPATGQEILLGNEAIARGLVESGCHIITSYPGTPSSEIIPAAVRFKKQLGLKTYIEWSVNEKVAYDIALGASYTGKRAAVVMKQVGLNVAADSLMSSAYTGVKGGLVIITCDDPGPHSSQTEQDSRFFAMFAKVPAFDPASPQEAKDLLPAAFAISEKFEIPVIFRPALRVCHAKQSVRSSKIKTVARKARFEKDSHRWAATPRYRFLLHQQLNQKIERIRSEFEKAVDINFITARGNKTPLGIIAAGVSFATVTDILHEYKLVHKIALLKIATPYPLPTRLVDRFVKQCKHVLILEETEGVIENQIIDKTKLLGRFNGIVPNEGELLPERIYDILRGVLKKVRVSVSLPKPDVTLDNLVDKLNLPIRRPTLCPGCPHRAAFFAMRKAFPKAIYPSDIGCYTLGLNLKAVDTCLDMGGGITLANGFYQAFQSDNQTMPIIATIGDSTFYHAGIPSLVNAVYNQAKFILIILDNSITAMTGMQPTPDLGTLADGTKGERVPLPELVKGCGVKFIRKSDPYDIKSFIQLIKNAYDYTQSPDGGMAVIIAKHPCPLYYREEHRSHQVEVRIEPEKCTGCKYCIKAFECPALIFNKTTEKVEISPKFCTKCGVCIMVCPQEAIVRV